MGLNVHSVVTKATPGINTWYLRRKALISGDTNWLYIKRLMNKCPLEDFKLEQND